MKYKYKYILALDPSGNFIEGKGTTGWVLIDKDKNIIDTGVIKATHFNKSEEYWNAHKNLIEYYNNKYKTSIIVVLEDYILYKNRSQSQTNSKMETCRLIGILQWYCWKIKQPYTLQRATEVKNRWADDILEYDGIIKKQGRYWVHTASGIYLNPVHKRDAFRHAIHYAICRNKEQPKKKLNNQGVKKQGYFTRANY